MKIKDFKVGQEVFMARQRRTGWLTRPMFVVSVGRKYVKVASEEEVKRDVPTKLLLSVDFYCLNEKKCYLVAHDYGQGGVYLFQSAEALDRWRETLKLARWLAVYVHDHDSDDYDLDCLKAVKKILTSTA